MSDPFQFDQPSPKLNRRRRERTGSLENEGKIGLELEEIPEVDVPNSSSRENFFDCFVAEQNLLPTHEQSIVDSIADNAEYNKPYVHVEESQEVELADDKTAVRSEDESCFRHEIANETTDQHEIDLRTEITGLEAHRALLEMEIKEEFVANEALEIDLTSKQDEYQEALQNLAFANKRFAELEKKYNACIEEYEVNETAKQQAEELEENISLAYKEIDELKEDLKEECDKTIIAEEELETVNWKTEKMLTELNTLHDENEALKTELLQESEMLEEMEKTVLSPVSQIQEIMRPERIIRHQDLFEDFNDLFPLHFGSNPEQILQFLDNSIAAEKEDPLYLPTFRELLYAAVRYRLIESCSELNYIRDSEVEELLLYDFNDVKLSGSFEHDLSPLNEIKMKLAIGQLEEAAELAERGGFFGIAQLISPSRQIDFENVQKNMPEETFEFMGLLRTLLDADLEQDGQDFNNIFHALGLTISLRSKLGFSEFKYRVLSFLRHDVPVELKELILIIAGVPCFYSAPFDFSYIKTGRSKTKESNFQQFLLKISKEFAVPTLEDFRLTEVYEYTFARCNMLPIKPRITPEMVNLQQFNDELSSDDLMYEKQASAADILSYMAFFPHLMPMKAAFSGISRKAASTNKEIAREAYFYGEIVIKNIKSLLEYKEESGVENISSNDDNFDEFSVYEAAVLPLKVTELAVRHPEVGASMEVWTNLGRYTSNFKKELKQMTKNSSDELFSGDVESMSLFYGKEIEIPEIVDEIEENNDFADEKSNEVSGLELHEEHGEGSELMEATDDSVCQSSEFQEGSQEMLALTEKPDTVGKSVDIKNLSPLKDEKSNTDDENIIPAIPSFERPVDNNEIIEPKTNAFSEEHLVKEHIITEEPPIPLLIEGSEENEDLLPSFESELSVNKHINVQPPPITKKSVNTPPIKEPINPFAGPISSTDSAPMSRKEGKEPPSVITADTGSKLSRKWSSHLKRWVEVDENGNEIAPPKLLVEPPPMMVPISDSITLNQSESVSEPKRRGTGRYKASE